MRALLVNAKPSLANALAEDCGVDVVAVWPQRHDFGPLLDTARVPALSYCGGAKLNPRAAWQMERIIRDVQPDVVHAFYGRALAHVNLATTAMRRRPRIVSFRGITSKLSLANGGDWLSYLHPHVDGHACESDAVRDSLVGCGIARDRCWTTYNTMYHLPGRRPGRAALAEFDVPADAFVVATVAAMRPVKCIDLLLRAAIECADLADVYWLLIGEVLDPLVHRLAADERVRDRVRLAGHRADASELISGADVFVMPSRAEALCQALLEAMHQRVCPIVSDAGGMKEVVRHGKDGLIVPSENVSALAGAIRLLHSKRQLIRQFADSSRARIADGFMPVQIAERTLTMYEALCGTERVAYPKPPAQKVAGRQCEYAISFTRRSATRHAYSEFRNMS